MTTITLAPDIHHLSRLIHAGTPAAKGEPSITDPALWEHTIRAKGRIRYAILRSDLINHIPTHAELIAHHRRHPEMWIALL